MYRSIIKHVSVQSMGIGHPKIALPNKMRHTFKEIIAIKYLHGKFSLINILCESVHLVKHKLEIEFIFDRGLFTPEIKLNGTITKFY